jgi:hypothetical protein
MCLACIASHRIAGPSQSQSFKRTSAKLSSAAAAAACCTTSVQSPPTNKTNKSNSRQYCSPAKQAKQANNHKPTAPSLPLSLALPRSQRQSSRHGPKGAVALAIGPVFRLPSAVEHGAQPVRIVEVSIKVSLA